MHLISKTYHFSAAHIIPGHPKCGRLHGHNYEVTVTITGPKLDSDGMILDYAELDKAVLPVMDEFDHKFLVGCIYTDELTDFLENSSYADSVVRLFRNYATAECIAESIAVAVESRLPFGVSIRSVVVKETPKTTAEFQYVY